MSRPASPRPARSGDGGRIASNYFDLAMIMDYWSDKRLNHHTEAASMLVPKLAQRAGNEQRCAD